MERSLNRYRQIADVRHQRDVAQRGESVGAAPDQHLRQMILAARPEDALSLCPI